MFRFVLEVVLVAFSAYVLSGCSKSSSNRPYSGPSSGSSPSSLRNGERSPSTGDYRGFTRPPLVVQQGQYFTWAMPSNWRANESANGVDMTSPDGKLIANSVLLAGNAGQTTPWNFLVDLLTRLGAHDINRVSTQDLPSQPSGYPGIYWQIQEFDLTFTEAGTSQHADFACGICNAYGGYSAVIQSFSAPVKEYEQAKTWLPLLAQSVLATNPGQIAYQNQLIPVRNRPLDNSGLMEWWQQKRLSQDRIAKAQHEGMMGYERMASPTTGQNYNMPLETYDGTVGGYHNPDHPHEILIPTRPGE